MQVSLAEPLILTEKGILRRGKKPKTQHLSYFVPTLIVVMAFPCPYPSPLGTRAEGSSREGWACRVGTALLAITALGPQRYPHIRASGSVASFSPATSSDRELLQLLMAPITAVIIVHIEVSLHFSSIFMHMTLKLISH